jgi:hypothetical protein
LATPKWRKEYIAANQYDWFVVPFYPLEPLTVCQFMAVEECQDVGNALDG